MPPLPGETLFSNLFADIHYYFSDPSTRPVHDRFDKGSYVYFYHNQVQHKTRIEVANAAGTPHQDAFSGYLDSVVVKHTYQQPNLFSLVVDRIPHSAHHQQDESHWCLPAYGPGSDQKYLYRLRSLDIYFWTASDASQLLESLQQLLPQNLDIIESTIAAEQRSSSAAEVRGSMSPVVEKLERAAILSPPREHMPSSGALPPDTPLQPIQLAPVVAPYNPAAPAAPEVIAHREKTPPPIDAESGTGLAAVTVNEQDSVPSLANQGPRQQVPQHRLYAGSPAFMPPPPSHPHQSQYASYSQNAYPPSPGLPVTPSAPPAYGYVSPLNSPGLVHSAMQSSGLAPPTGIPVGGYSHYSYEQQIQHPSKQDEVYGVHSAVYRPTEAEAAHGHGHKPAKSAPVKPGGFEDRVDKLEKGVGRFLRRLDKKI